MDIVQNESGSNYLRDMFYHETFNANDTIDLYIGHILSYQQRLAGIKQELTNEDIRTKLLTILPSLYQVVNEVMFNQPDRTIILVIASLRRQAEITYENPPEPSAGATYSRGLYAGKCSIPQLSFPQRSFLQRSFP